MGKAHSQQRVVRRRKAPKGWRKLKPDEHNRRGDKYYVHGKWEAVSHARYAIGDPCYYIRKNKPPNTKAS